MGDYGSPRRRDLYDRLRRRFDQYRRRHMNINERYGQLASGQYEPQRQDTLLLHQRWLESKAKKSVRNSKSNNNNSSGTSSGAVNSGARDTSGNQGDRNTNNQLAKKRKSEEDLPPAATATTVDQVYNFDDSAGPDHPGPSASTQQSADGQDTCLRSQVSVNIIQQINTQGDCTGNQTSKIKLTVSSTVHTGSTNKKATGVSSAQSNVSQTSTKKKKVPTATLR